MPAAVSPSTPATSTPALKKSSVATMKASASVSAPSTPNGRKKKTLYVYSRGTGTTIYANQQQASSAARRGLANGSFRKVDVTTSTGDAFDIASESALEVKRTKNVYSLRDFGHSLQEAPRSTPVARAGNLSADGRRADIQHIPLESQSRPSSSATPPVDYDDDWLDMSSEVNNMEPMSRVRKRKWTTPFVIGLPISKMRTCESLSLGRAAWGKTVHACAGSMRSIDARNALAGGCTAKAASWKCIGYLLYVALRKELRSLGLRVQLSHTDNQRCPRAHPGRDKFVSI
ncbi:hypothetical protein B0H14DRAFT_2616120 [Mycena olivaceomarginata]|nr:hypothetical protein B0H14DRAFT_2616120 [Mycena olivaceomarginata]